MTKLTLGSLVLLGTLPALGAAVDLSKYRDFQLGTGLPAILQQTGVDPALAKTIHRRPDLIQELEWRPRQVGPAARTEAVEDVLFSFYDGSLFRIAVNYDRYETEGLTADDLIDAISAAYGPAVRPIAAKVKTDQSPSGDEEEVLARWEDPEYRFELMRTSYGPSFKLIGLMKRAEARANVANLEAARLDNQEAPQREAARVATEEETARAKLEKARLVNKPKFRP